MSVSSKKGKGLMPSRVEGKTDGYSHYHQETIEDVNRLPIVAVPQQSIIKEDAVYYNIRSRINPENSRELLATYFPSYNQEGVLTGYKKRDWTIPKEQKFHFTVVGAVSVKNQMFGQNLCKKGSKTLIQVEGEGDVVAARRGVLESLKGTKWEGKIQPNVVGLNCGAGNAAETVAHNEKFIRSFETYVMALDSDHATPKEALLGVKKGKEATEDIAAYLLMDSIRCVDLGDYKDPREMLDDGKAIELGKLLTFGHEKYSPEKIVSGDDSDLDFLLEPLKEGHYINRYPKMMEKIKGLRCGNELITYAAFSGVGKSTLSREVMWELDKAGYTVGAIFLEEPMKKTQQALLALELGIPLPIFRENPLKVATREAISEAREKVLANGRTYFLNHFGSLKVEKLMDQIKYLHFICGCEHIFIDHVSMVVAGLDTNERKDLDMLYEALAAFMTVNKVTIHAVCHLKRVDDYKQSKKQKDGEEPEAYWREVRKEMLRGCVDKDTEFLSQHGWKKISDYQQGDLVCQHNQQGKVNFIEPQQYIKLPCEKMYSFKTSKGLDMVLSGEHRICYKTERDKSKFKFITAEDAIKLHNTQSTGFRGLIPTTFETSETGTLGLTDDEIRLQIAVNADSWIRNVKTGLCSIRIKKQYKIDRLKYLLEKVGYKYSLFELSGDRKEFSFHAPMKYKGITRDWYKLQQRELQIISDEVRWWDGDINSGRFSCINKDESDFIQFVYSATGKRSGVRTKESHFTILPKNDGTGEKKKYKTKPLHHVSCVSNKFVSFRKALNAKPEVCDYIPTDGYKYCFKVETGMFLARRNGKLFVTGNSSGIEQMSSIIIMLENEVLPDGTRGRVRVRIEKNREWSYLGIADTLNMDDRGILCVCEDEDYYNKHPEYRPDSNNNSKFSTKKKEVSNTITMAAPSYTPQAIEIPDMGD